MFYSGCWSFCDSSRPDSSSNVSTLRNHNILVTCWQHHGEPSIDAVWIEETNQRNGLLRKLGTNWFAIIFAHVILTHPSCAQEYPSHWDETCCIWRAPSVVTETLAHWFEELEEVFPWCWSWQVPGSWTCWQDCEMFWITQHVVLEVFYCVELINVGTREANNPPGRDMEKMTPAMLNVFGKSKLPTIARWICAPLASLPDSHV